MTDWNENNQNDNNNWNADEHARREGEMNGNQNMGETGKMRETSGSENSDDREMYGVYESYESFEAFDADGKPMIIESEKEFDEVVAEGVAMIDFYAKWCGPCRMTGATFDSLAQRFAGRATIAKVDVDAHPKLGTKCDISAVPTVLLYEDGELRERFVGVRSEAELADALEIALTGVNV
ncbi:MAG: hypothetical protein IKU86_12665 [Thermoguttaceae bacterium]|nr:hypothetical protein [Thermoguttaceae bacterium]